MADIGNLCHKIEKGKPKKPSQETTVRFTINMKVSIESDPVDFVVTCRFSHLNPDLIYKCHCTYRQDKSRLGTTKNK